MTQLYVNGSNFTDFYYKNGVDSMMCVFVSDDDPDRVYKTATTTEVKDPDLYYAINYTWCDTPSLANK
jgi:hypothetical protein